MTFSIGTSLRSRLSASFRAKRAVILRDVLANLAQGLNELRVLDVGGRVSYWDQIGRDFLSVNRVKVTILNVASAEVGAEDDTFESAIGDGCKLEYKDGQFDLVHSNSVIEHVGDWRRAKEFARETRRVGKHYFVQTPYFWFPIDPHFYAFPAFHWLPRPIGARLLAELPLSAVGRLSADNAFEKWDDTRLLDVRQYRLLFPDATISFERFVGLRKSMIAIR